TQEPSLTATQILSRLASREHTLKVISRRQIAGVAIALMLSSLALLSPSLQKPILPAPVQMAATSLPFASSRVMVEWSPGHKMGKIFASQLKVIPNSVLEVWLIKDRKHVPVAIIPLSSHDETVMFAVPKKARNAEAIGITLEHSPNMPKPTGPRVFYHKFH
ncbi:anti-sigma factor domain-containing protein, partial [Sulfobacillus thermosulfidooxidans]